VSGATFPVLWMGGGDHVVGFLIQGGAYRERKFSNGQGKISLTLALRLLELLFS